MRPGQHHLDENEFLGLCIPSRHQTAQDQEVYIKTAGLLSSGEVDLSHIQDQEEGDEDTRVIRTTASQRRCSAAMSLDTIRGHALANQHHQLPTQTFVDPCCWQPFND